MGHAQHKLSELHWQNDWLESAPWVINFSAQLAREHPTPMLVHAQEACVSPVPWLPRQMPQGGGGLHKSLPSSTPKCIHLLLFLKEVPETEWRLCGAEAREVMGANGHTVVWRHRDRETQEQLGPG